MTFEELVSEYITFGQSPFRSVNISNWHIDGLQIATEAFPFADDDPTIHNEIFFSFNQGAGFFSTFFNQVRTPTFAADMLTWYTREFGNPYNANFDDDTTLPLQRKYSIIDTFAGVFTEHGADRVNFNENVIDPGFVGTYGDAFVDFYQTLERNDPNIRSYWYVSFVIFDPGPQRLMRAPTEVEDLFERATVYEQNNFSNVDENGFQTVTTADQAALLEQIGEDVAADIEREQVAALVARLGADYTRDELIDLSPDGN